MIPGRDTPVRTCVACRTTSPQASLARFVSLDGSGILEDTSRRLPGRGAYVHDTPGCRERALKNNLLGRTLRTTGQGAAQLGQASHEDQV